MIKKAKKSVAVGLSVALAVTSVNIPVNSASAAAKKAKLSATKKTITAGKSSTLTLKTNKKKSTTIKTIGTKYVKVSTSKSSVATVKKVTKSTKVKGKKLTKVTGIKVTAKKAGKATITVKVTSGTYKGTYKCAVTVKAKSQPTKAPTEAPVETETPTETPVETEAPTVEPSGEPATNPGITAEPAIKAAKVEGNVTNSIADYDNTVLANQNANVRFKVTDANGNALKNETVTISLKNETTLPSTGVEYYINGDKKILVTTTDDEGYAKLVLAPEKNITSDKKAASVACYELTVVCGSDETVKDTVKVSVGAVVYNPIALTTVDVSNQHRATNAVTAGSAWKAETKNILGKSVPYVSTQQVSSADGKKNHSLQFGTSVKIALPAKDGEESKASKYVQPVNISSGKYHTYGTVSKDIEFEIKDMSKVAYATLYFKNLSVSEKTNVKVYGINLDGTRGAEITTGKNWTAYKTTGQALQIENEKLVPFKGLRVVATAKGQVNTKQNDGFDIEDLTYVYNTKTGGSAVDTKPLKSVKIDWESVTPRFSTEAIYEEPEGTPADKLVVDATKKENATYTVPVFPYVGNGIITVYDSNGKVARYYAVPTKNNGNNVNVLANTSTSNFPYRISEDEAKNSVNPGTLKVSEDGTTVTVNSKKSGAQYIKATITSTDKNVELDANNSEDYTYVMWNPIENSEAAKAATDTFFALEGQKVDVVAQLADKNGNKESTENVGITFVDAANDKLEKNRSYGNNYGGEDLAANKAVYAGYGFRGTATVTDLTNEGKTDKNGQVKLTLEGTDAVELIGLTAKSADSKYNVELYVNGKKVENTAELYWARLGLKYESDVDSSVKRDTIEKGYETVDVAAQTYNVDDAWEVATETVAEFPAVNGSYKNDNHKMSLGVDGVNTVIKAGYDSEGKVEASTTKPGMAVISSSKGGEGSAVYTIDKTSVSATKFTVNGVAKEGAGYGDTSADEKMTINYKFTASSVQVKNVVPTGTYAVAGKVKLAFVKVSSLTGSVDMKDRYVEFTLPESGAASFVTDSAADTMKSVTTTNTVEDSVTSGSKKVIAKTDKNGIAVVAFESATAGKFKLNASLLGDTNGAEPTAATYKYDSTEAKCDATYEFKNVSGFAFDTGLDKNDKSKITYDNNSITLVFNQELVETSVISEVFAVKYSAIGDGSDEKTFSKSISKVELVDGKKVVISFSSDVFAGHSDASKLTVTVGTALVKGVTYALTSDDGQTLSDTLTYSLTDGAISANATAAAAKEQTATTKADAIKNATTLDGFNTAYADYTGETDAEVKALIESKVTDLAARKSNADKLSNAESAVTNGSYAGLVDGSKKIADLTNKVETFATSEVSVSTTEAADTLLTNTPYTYTLTCGGLTTTVNVTPEV